MFYLQQIFAFWVDGLKLQDTISVSDMIAGKDSDPLGKDGAQFTDNTAWSQQAQ